LFDSTFSRKKHTMAHFSTPRFSKLIIASSIAIALSACGGSDNFIKQPGATAGDVFVLTASNKLMSFNRAAPATLLTTTTVTGLGGGERLVGIDYRPANGMLYGVTISGSTGRIYTIDAGTGVASFMAILAADAADTSAPYSGLTGVDFGVDFNPAADRLRVVSDTGLNLRINVATGATTTDGEINGVAGAKITGSAYTNSFPAAVSTTLYAIDANTLYTQNPPNDGTLSAPVALGVTAGSVNGFDIDAVTNTGYAALTVGGVRNFYSINLSAPNGGTAATLVGALGVSENILGMALRTVKAPVVYGLTDDNELTTFKPLTPNTIDASVAITALASGESLLGIDIRPADNMLYGITSAGKIVTINVVNGAATMVSTLNVALDGTQFAVDFNPAADRLRVISDTGQNLRINVMTGATTVDGSLNGVAGALVTAAAYTNSFAGTTTTELYDIDTNGDSLLLQNPPNDGGLVSVGALGLNVEGNLGIDIAGVANGMVLAALRTSAGGPTSLYKISLSSGAATLVNGAANPSLSAIGAGTTGLRDIAISIK
jgi:hypothetical protein